MVGQPVTVELKNDLAITGVLVSVDQFLNIKLDNIKVVDEERYPHMVRVSHKQFPLAKKKRANKYTIFFFSLGDRVIAYRTEESRKKN